MPLEDAAVTVEPEVSDVHGELTHKAVFTLLDSTICLNVVCLHCLAC